MDKKASVLDYVKPGLDPKVWASDGTLLPNHKEQILEELNNFLLTTGLEHANEWITFIHIVGSLTTYQYISDTDLDIHMGIDLPTFIRTEKPLLSPEEAEEFLDNIRLIEDRKKLLLTGTKHPIEYYFELPSKHQENSAIGVYNIVTDQWEKPPVSISSDFDIEKSKPQFIADAVELASGMDISFGKIKREIKRIEELQEAVAVWTSAERKKFQEKLEAKLAIIESEIEELIKTKEQVVEDRRGPNFDPKSEQEVKFKYLQKFGYFYIITQLKELLEHADETIHVEEGDLPEIKEIVHEASIHVMSGEDNHILMIDFDKTICGHDGNLLPGVEGAFKKLHEDGWTLIIYSVRSNNEEGRKYIEDYMSEHHLEYDDIFVGKPLADYYIDDRAIQFKDWSDVLKQVNPVEKEASRQGKYWLAPDGKVFEVPTIHATWVEKNLDMLVDTYGLSRSELFNLTQEPGWIEINEYLIENGWARIGDLQPHFRGFGLEVQDIHNIPQFALNYIESHAEGNGKLDVADLKGNFVHLSGDELHNIQKEITYKLRHPEMQQAANKEAAQQVEYPYSSTQFNLPKDVAQKIVEWSVKNIPNEDLYEDDSNRYGRELESHITLLYGLTTNEADEVLEILKNESKIKVKFGKTKYFKTKLGQDVINIPVQSNDIIRLHEKVKKLDHETLQEEYVPHVTVAYVKEGLGKKYTDQDVLGDLELELDLVKFSPKEGDSTNIELRNSKKLITVADFLQQNEVPYKVAFDDKTVKVGTLNVNGKKVPVIVSQTLLMTYLETIKRLNGITETDDSVTAWTADEDRRAAHNEAVADAIQRMGIDSDEYFDVIRNMISEFAEDMFDKKYGSLDYKAEFLPSISNAPTNKWQTDSDVEIAVKPDPISDETTYFQPPAGKPRKSMWKQILDVLFKKKEATIKKSMSDHAAWIDPNGKVYPVRSGGLGGTHKGWIEANADLLRKDYGYEIPNEGKFMSDGINRRIFDSMLHDGWIRVGDSLKRNTYVSFQVPNMKNIPSYVDDYLASFYEDEMKIEVEEGGTFSNVGKTVALDNPFPTLQKAVNRALVSDLPLAASLDREAEILKVQPYGGGMDFPVLVNPTMNEVLGLLKKAGNQLRYIEDNHGYLYVWNAMYATHDHMLETLVDLGYMVSYEDYEECQFFDDEKEIQNFFRTKVSSIEAAFELQYWIDPNGQEYQGDVLKQEGVQPQKLLHEGWVQVLVPSDHRGLVLVVDELEFVPDFMNAYLAKTVGYGETITIRDVRGNTIALRYPFKNIRNQIKRQLYAPEQMSASLNKIAGIHLWLDGNGNKHETNNQTHYMWVIGHRKMLAKIYGLPLKLDNEEAYNWLFDNNWTRVTDDHDNLSFEIGSLSKIPSYLDDFLFSNVTQNDEEISIADNKGSGLYNIVYPFEEGSLQEQINREFLSTKIPRAAFLLIASVADDILKLIQETGGASYNLSNGNLSGKEMYAVSLYPERTVTFNQPVTEKDIDNYLHENSDILGGNNSFGAWYNKADGKTYFDVVVTLSDRDQSIELAKKHNQIAIFDLKNFVEIPTGGTGEVQSKQASGSFLVHGNRVFENPTVQEVKNLRNKSKEKAIRVFVDPWTHAAYVWDANIMNHDEVYQFLGYKFGEIDDEYLHVLYDDADVESYYGQLVNSNLKISSSNIFEVKNTKVYMNPTPEQARNLCGEFGLRYLSLSDGTLYMWNALDVVHKDVMDSLGLDFASGNFDYQTGIVIDPSGAENIAEQFSKDRGEKEESLFASAASNDVITVDEFLGASPKNNTTWDDPNQTGNVLPVTYSPENSDDNLNSKYPYRFMGRPKGDYSNANEMIDMIMNHSMLSRHVLATNVLELSNLPPVYENPTIEDAILAFARSDEKSLRYMLDPGGFNLYMWDGSQATHYDVASALGFGERYNGVEEDQGQVFSQKDAVAIAENFQKHAQKHASNMPKKAFSAHRYWVAPNGKYYDVTENGSSNHAEWVFSNISLISKSGIPITKKSDYYEVAAQMLQKGWVRVGEYGSGGAVVELYNIKNIPLHIDAVLSSFLTDGERITVSDMNHNAVEVVYPFKSLQNAVRRALKGSILIDAVDYSNEDQEAIYNEQHEYHDNSQGMGGGDGGGWTPHDFNNSTTDYPKAKDLQPVQVFLDKLEKDKTPPIASYEVTWFNSQPRQDDTN